MADRIITPEEAARDRARRIAEHLASMTMDDYNKALEQYLLEVRAQRGYTDRDPSEYFNSGIVRWAQDAQDWIKFRDAVMIYGLSIFNQYQEAGTAPCTLDEFIDGLHKIECHWTYE